MAVEDVLRFALVDDQRVEAQPKLKGLCPGCLQPVTAKCGTRRIWHWAHHTERMCDRWWEPEKEWHRTWKDKFHAEWQESIKHDDQSGEKHIADVRTSHGLVIEFQHSPLDPQERAARERFYQNMVWVVDGTRLKNDYLRFSKGTHQHQCIGEVEVLIAPRPEKCLPASWLESAVPVLFDFRGVTPIDPCDAKHEYPWCLFPDRAEGNAVLAAVSCQQFVEKASSSSHLFDTCQILSIVEEQIRQQREMHIMNVRMYLQKHRRLPRWI